MSELKFYCHSCHKKLEEFEAHHLSGEDIYDVESGIRYNPGVNYCKECYDAMVNPVQTNETTKQEVKTVKQEPKDQLGEKVAIPENKPLLVSGKMSQITDLKSGDTEVNLFVEVTDKYEKKVEKYGRILRLGVFKIKDETGETELILWEKTVDWINKGDRILLKNCFIRKFNDKKQVTLGKNGEIVKSNDSKS